MPGECRGTMLMMLISLMDTLAWWMWITKANVFIFFPILSLEMRHWSCLLGEGRRLFAREIQDGRPGLTLVLQRLTMVIFWYLWYGIFESVVTGFVVMAWSTYGTNERIMTDKSKTCFWYRVYKTSVSLLLRRSWKKILFGYRWPCILSNVTVLMPKINRQSSKLVNFELNKRICKNNFKKFRNTI